MKGKNHYLVEIFYYNPVITVIITRIGTATTIITAMAAIAILTGVTLGMVRNVQVLRGIGAECCYFDNMSYTSYNRKCI